MNPVDPRQGPSGIPPQPLPYQSMPVGGVACPNCRNPSSTPVSFTWWGGVIGPKLLNHVKCVGCGTAYNGKTGQYNTTGIIIYTVVVLAIVAAIYMFAFMK